MREAPKFRKTLFGYKASEVQSYLRLMSSEIEEYKEREKMLKDMMLGAQRVAEELRVNAQQDAEFIVSRAELSAERMTDEAQKRRARMWLEIQDLKRRHDHMVVELRALLQHHTEVFAHQQVEQVIPFSQAMPDDEVTRESNQVSN